MGLQPGYSQCFLYFNQDFNEILRLQPALLTLYGTPISPTTSLPNSMLLACSATAPAGDGDAPRSFAHAKDLLRDVCACTQIIHQEVYSCLSSHLRFGMSHVTLFRIQKGPQVTFQAVKFPVAYLLLSVLRSVLTQLLIGLAINQSGADFPVLLSPFAQLTVHSCCQDFPAC